MAENMGGTETPPDYSCQPLSDNLSKIIQKQGCHSIKMVQLYLVIQNVLAAFNSHALNISRAQCKALCWRDRPQNKNWRDAHMNNPGLALRESVTQDPGSPSASQL